MRPKQVLRVSARPAGFSVVELMVAISLMSVIVFALYSMFNQTQKALRSNIGQVDVLESGRAALEMMGRELEQIAPSSVDYITNFYAALIPIPMVVQTDMNSGLPLRTNVLQEYFFLTSRTNQWTGTGYRVTEAQHGVGTLQRFTIQTNASALTQLDWVRAFRGVNPTNLHRVAEGIIHLRVRAFDRSGRLVTNQLPFVRVGTFNNIVPGTELAFLGDALPAYVELELGVLDPDALGQYHLLRESPAGVATKFLRERANKVHIFRQRIPIRTASQ